ncbi:aspartate aminotransferase family protein [Sneathiella sp. HT1-7]|jgi:acetylornithine/N-succinyldiaminopimelate aminotransferase|uniref:aspartate aminotransferase family protein n=1 Tax=Sneathiella sp. HT1-7 TaxID=2887192 RepID=UPI001D1475B9|nr:aspartate aminotransferase family protein [Sneathiella sp. HT1-7]MCC3304159.1 aspartate aminotransferase family protein [Sneathiella sp. HT1-7]
MIPALLSNYAPADLSFEKGEGMYLYGNDGRRYLDFAAGIAVSALGHAHPKLVAALTDQASKVWHVSNMFRIPGQEELAEKLVNATFADAVYFCNSGAEANECGLKMVRKYFSANGHPEKYRVIAFENSFHGRTLATIAAAGQQKLLDGFGPAVKGFDHVPVGDIEKVKAAITNETAAILIEPVLGEGGIQVVEAEFMRALRELCDEHGLLLMLDEIQTGMGRTGKLFAHEHAGITPDILTSAKALGGGFPVGACLAVEKVAKAMTVGSHGSTYGGNPLAMAVAGAVVDVITEEGFLDHVSQMGNHLKQGLAGVVDRHPDILEEIRGIGLHIGLKCKVENTKVGDKLLELGVLTAKGGDNVVRLLPPLVIEDTQISEFIGLLDEACTELENG